MTKRLGFLPWTKSSGGQWLWTRRVLLVLGLLSALPSSGHAADAVRVGQSIAACFCFLPVRVAEQIGVWKKHELAVQLLILRGDAQEMQALTAGSIDIGLGSGSSIGLISKGIPARSVAATADSLADMGLIVPVNGVSNIDQLNGKRLGVSSAGSLTYWLSRKISQHEGWQPTAITPVSLGDLDANVAGLKSGAVDGIVFGVEAGYLLGDQGTGKLLLTFDKIVPSFISHAMFGTDALIKDKPDVLRRFVQGWFETVDWMGQHKVETVKLATEATKLPEDVMSRTYDTVMPTMSHDGRFNPEALKALAQSFVELGMLPTVIDPNGFIDTQFLPPKR